jgi:hypothetical protein
VGSFLAQPLHAIRIGGDFGLEYGRGVGVRNKRGHSGISSFFPFFLFFSFPPPFFVPRGTFRCEGVWRHLKFSCHLGIMGSTLGSARRREGGP